MQSKTKYVSIVAVVFVALGSATAYVSMQGNFDLSVFRGQAPPGDAGQADAPAGAGPVPVTQQQNCMQVDCGTVREDFDSFSPEILPLPFRYGPSKNSAENSAGVWLPAVRNQLKNYFNCDDAKEAAEDGGLKHDNPECQPDKDDDIECRVRQAIPSCVVIDAIETDLGGNKRFRADILCKVKCPCWQDFKLNVVCSREEKGICCQNSTGRCRMFTERFCKGIEGSKWIEGDNDGEECGSRPDDPDDPDNPCEKMVESEEDPFIDGGDVLSEEPKSHDPGDDTYPSGNAGGMDESGDYGSEEDVMEE